MDLDFYLSEMSVSDGHGGGLTLQRVLGEDLDRINFFAHVSAFAIGHPVIERLKPRCLDLLSPLEKDAVRRKIGCRPAHWLSERPMLRAWNGKRAAREIAAKFTEKKRPLRALVCPQGAASLHTMESLIRLCPVDYISWIMDDHLVRWRNGAWEYPNGAEALFARHLKGAKQVFVISPALAEFYYQRFGVEAQVLFGPANVYEWPIETDMERKREIRLGYFGAVTSWQLDALALLANGLSAAGAVLDIYSGLDSLPQMLQRPSISLKGRIPAHQVAETMRSYDAVVLPISFHPEMRHMSEFNIATKMSECLASGTITLAIGPTYAAMIRFLQPTGAACLLTDISLANLSELTNNLKKPAFRHPILERARELVLAELSVSIMSRRWSVALASLNNGAEPTV